VCAESGYLHIMKQHYILFVLMSVILFACGKKQEEKLCKKWIVYKVDFENIDKDTVGQDPLQTGMEDVFKELMSNMLSNTEYTFNEDGSYDVLYGTNKNKGTWKLEDSGNTLIMTKPDKDKKQQPKPAIIERLDDTSMVLMMKADQSSYNVRLLMKEVKGETAH
jgi:hypothetical protein